MTSAMTPKQRKECAANQQQLQERLTALAEKRKHVANDVKTHSDDMAAGIDGARAAALNGADDLRAIDFEIEAVERLLQAEIDRETADMPFLKQERLVEAHKVLDAAKAVQAEKAKAVGDTLLAAAKAISDHENSLVEVVKAGADPHLMHQAMPQYWLMPALAAAGVPGLPANLAQAPNSLESYMRAILR